MPTNPGLLIALLAAFAGYMLIANFFYRHYNSVDEGSRLGVVVAALWPLWPPVACYLWFHWRRVDRKKRKATQNHAD